MKVLYQECRPTKWSGVVGQREAVQTIRRVARKGLGSRAFWISGASGSGKTTIARLIAAEIADDFYIEEFDSAESFTADAYNDIEKTMCLYGGGKGGRAYIVNEAHGLRVWMIRRLLGLLERLPDHVIFIFTTTKEGQAGLFDLQIDAGPLLSRCIHVPLVSGKNLANSFARLCKRIAEAEGLDGRPLSAYRKLAAECDNNCRTMLQTIEAGQMIEGTK